MVSLAAAPDKSGKRADADVWLVHYDQRKGVPIKRGENTVNKLSYFNVVRDMRALGQWRGEAIQLDLSREELAEGGRDGCAIIVQKGSVGPSSPPPASPYRHWCLFRRYSRQNYHAV